jgi:hypothetical protein
MDVRMDVEKDMSWVLMAGTSGKDGPRRMA